MFAIGTAIFFLAYAAIVSERVHRTTVALSGAALMIVTGVIVQSDAIAAIDFNTIGLLIGMMIIVSITKHTGLFQYVAIRAAQVAKGEPWLILLALSLITALFSSVLDNVTTILLIGPVTFVIASNLKISPIPFLIAEIILANLGGGASLVGDPVNILVGSAAEFTFLDFLVNAAPIIVIMIPVVLLIFKIRYGAQLQTTEELKKSILEFKAVSAIKDKDLLIKSLLVLGLVVIGFLLHGIIHLQPATIALFGAALLLVISGSNPETILEELEWTTILFFAGLFVLVAGIENIGLIDMFADALLSITQGEPTATTMAIFWGAGLFSGVVDNLPFAATMIPVVQELGSAGVPIDQLWWALIFGAILGGNATLIGASTNLVAAGLAERSGYHLGFKEFFKVGALVMIVTMVITTAYIYLRYLM